MTANAFSYTKGTWRSTASSLRYVTVSAGDKIICIVDGCERSAAELWSNAELICAAPDLFAQLEALTNAMTGTALPSASQSFALQNARHLIHRLRGTS